MLRVACCMLHVACCAWTRSSTPMPVSVLHERGEVSVACCMLHVARGVWRVEGDERDEAWEAGGVVLEERGGEEGDAS